VSNTSEREIFEASAKARVPESSNPGAHVGHALVGDGSSEWVERGFVGSSAWVFYAARVLNASSVGSQIHSSRISC
jgi:hypothetical protein